MKHVALTYQSCGVEKDAFRIQAERLRPEIARVAAAWGTGYESEYASLSLPADHAMRAEIQKAAQEKLALIPRALIVCGIGGSNLGAQAVYEMLSSVGTTSEMPVYWADTVDPDYIGMMYDKVEKELVLGHNVLLVIISKSGATTETVANAELFLQLLAQYKKNDTHSYVVAITDRDSALWKLAHKNKFTRLEIPKNVGGRYSLCSAAGLFPLAMMGVAIGDLAEGAESIKKMCTDLDGEKNSAALRAIMLYEQYRKGVRVQDLFVFAVALRGFGAWYRQLMGESIGKAHDRGGKAVNVGIVPTVSVGSIDLHSVGQLYLSGPRVSFTTFITIAYRNRSLSVPNMPEFDVLVPHLQKKSYATIMDAILQGTQRAYERDNRPFATLELPEISAYHGGQLLQLAMVEMMYLGFLFNINPFDQPQVELYKKETREILAHE